MQVETKPWQIQLPSRKLEVELTTLSSNYHVEMNPSDVGNNDRYVVQEIIKVCRGGRCGGPQVAGRGCLVPGHQVLFIGRMLMDTAACIADAHGAEAPREPRSCGGRPI